MKPFNCVQTIAILVSTQINPKILRICITYQKTITFNTSKYFYK